MDRGDKTRSSPHDEQPRYQPLVIAAAAVCAGIFCDRQAKLPFEYWLASAGASWCAWLPLWRRNRQRFSAAALALCLASLGGAWHHFRFDLFARDELGLYAGEHPQPACVEAIALGRPRRAPAPPADPLCAIPRGDRSRLVVQLTGLRQGETWQSASGRARLTVDGHLLGVRAGDRLQIFCHLSAPAAVQNPGEFDFAQHARGDRELSLLSADFPDCVTVQGRGGERRWHDGLELLRERGREWLWNQLSSDRAGLASALLLGIREDLDQESTDAFTQTGTVHLLSISGLHVGILAGFLLAIVRLGLLARGPAMAAVALIVTGYALLIDAEPPAARATVLVLAYCLANYLRRPLPAFNALAAAALAVLAWNPADLFRIGPQLSFLAVAALAWFGPRLRPRRLDDPLERLIADARPWPERALRWLGGSLWQTTALSFCVWAVSAPLVMAHFHLLSPATLVLTPILAVPVGAGLISGFAALALGWVLPPLGAACASICDRSLGSVDAAIGFAAACRGSHLWLPGPEPWWLWGFYGALGLWAVAPRWRPPRRWIVAILAAWSALGIGAAIFKLHHEARLDCHFLSVGHGGAVLVELPDGKKLLYDAGRLGSPAGGARSVASFLWSRGLTHIDAIVLSHADVDHYNAVPELLERFSVGAIYVSPLMLQDEGAAMKKLREAIERFHAPLVETVAGDRLRIGDACRAEVLHPTLTRRIASDNANSVVLLLEYQGRRILLTGDLEPPGMDDLLAEAPLDCDVILAPHHGSLRSNPSAFAAWSTPEWVVVSGGHADNRPEFARAYERCGAQILNTADCGTISVRISAGELAVETLRNESSPGLARAEETLNR